VGHRPCPIAILPNLHMIYELLQNLTGKHHVAFLLLFAWQKIGVVCSYPCSISYIIIKGRSSYSACTYHTPNTNILVMKRKFVNKSWIFCIPVVIFMTNHFFTHGKWGLIRKSTKFGLTFPSCTD
jgi:hypothetical protein